jgi:hypothetical protein
MFYEFDHNYLLQLDIASKVFLEVCSSLDFNIFFFLEVLVIKIIDNYDISIYLL